MTMLKNFRRDDRGTAIMEFALTAPLFLLVLMGIFDFAWQMYAKQVLSGVVAEAGRASTLEDNAADQARLDAKVEREVLKIFRKADVGFERKSYSNFDQVGDPEDYTDSNKNGRYDKGECFQDANGNGSWDADRGRTGNGNADDVVVYTATMEFKRVLPVWKMLGQPQETRISASTVLRNQPYGASSSATVVICK